MSGALPLDAVPSRRIGDVAAEAIRAAILDGRLGPGERLKEAAVASRLQLSRTPVRQALAVLEAEGLVEIVPHLGARVASYTRTALAEHYELRETLEALAARRACRHARPEDIDALRASCVRYAQAGFHEDPDRAVDENRRFHDLVAQAGGSDRLRQMAKSLAAVPLMYQSAHWADAEYERRAIEFHRAITEAIADRDEERAERQVRAHLEAGHQIVSRHVVADDEPTSTAPKEAR